MRAPLLTAARLLPVLALLFVPILAGVAYVYPWADHPGRYLNVPFFAARSVAYLAIWILLARSFESRPAVGLVVYAFTMSFAAFDWIASLTPEWHSSGFGRASSNCANS